MCIFLFSIRNLDAQPRIIYVTQTGSGNHDGTSWGNAMSNLKTALDSAAIWIAQENEIQVWVAQGTYYGDTTGADSSELSIAFALADGVSIYGGFVGNEPTTCDLSQRDYGAHPTILDGQGLQTVIGVPVEIISNISTALTGYIHHTVCDGFIIQNGYGIAGALLLGNMELSHCIIRNNQGDGGGLYSLGHATNPVTLKHCSITSNMGVAGGGMLLHTIVDSCMISGNTGATVGGLYTIGSNIQHCEISDNLLTGETGDMKTSGCLAMASAIEYCKIVHNSTENLNVGGIEFFYEAEAAEVYGVSNNESSTVDNCLVADNDGVGIGILNGLANITNSTIANNDFMDVAANPNLNSNSVPVLTNCIIWSEGKDNVTQGIVIGHHCAVTGGLAGSNNIRLSTDNIGSASDTLYVAFVDPQNGDYHLTQYSDCIDAGTELSPTCTLDLGGGARLFGANPDLGCFEYQGIFCRPASKLTVSDVEGRSALVSWESVSDTDSFSVFDLEYKAMDDTLWHINAGLTSTKLELNDLSPNTVYTVRVRRTCDSANASRYINSYFQTTCEYDLVPEKITVAPSNSSLAGEFLPTDCYYEHSYSQQIYTAAELNSSPASITSVGLQYYYNEPVSREIDLYIGHTSKEYFDSNNDWIPTDSMWMAFSGTITFQNTNDGNWVFIPLDDVFYYNGSDNLVIAIDDNTNNYIDYEIPRFYTHNTSDSRSLTTSGFSDIDPNNCSGGEFVSRYSYRNNLQLLAGLTCPDTGCARSKFAVSNLTETTLDLELSIGTDVPNVELKYYPLAGLDTNFVILDITDSIYHITGLNAGTAYRICARSICDTNYTSSWFERTIVTLLNSENIIYVSEQATGDNSGSSWANAKTSLAEALDLASLQSAENTYPTIWVAQGTYYRDTTETADMEIPIAFALSDGVNMYGGFAGNEPATFDLSQRDFGAHPTILDGQGQQTVIGIPTEAIVELEETFASGGTFVGYERHTVCDGFTIQNGNGIGGALLLGNMELSHCIIRNNQGGEAGGVYTIGHASSPAILKHCDITSNTGAGGGGFLINAIVDSCIFSENTGYMSGGPVVLGSKLRHCEISDNLLTGESDDMKASGCLAMASEIEYCKIVHNSTENLNIGGVEFFYETEMEEFYGVFGNSSMDNCLIADNNGIGVGFLTGLVNVTNSTIANNAYVDVATHSDINNNTAPVFTNCIIWSEGTKSVTQGIIIGHHCAVTGGLAGTGNITLDKENVGISDITSPVAFVNPQNGDYRLTQVSVCVDAGATSALTSLDLAGNPRVFGASPDMGCFEYHGETYCLTGVSLSADEVTTTSANVTWSLTDTTITPVGYELAYQLKGASQWTIIPDLSENQFLLEDLPACSQLSVKVRVFCDSLSEGFLSPTLDFRTPCCDEISDSYTFVIGNTESSEQGDMLPINMWFQYSFTQQLFLASELGNTSLEVDTIAFQYFSETPETRQLDIYLGHTSKETFNDGSDWINYDSLSLVFSGPVNFSNDGENHWYTIPLENIFSYNGVNNLVLVVDDNTGSFQSHSDRFYTHNSNANRTLFAYTDGTDYNPYNPGILNTTTFRNNIQFRGKQCLDGVCPPLNASVGDASDTSALIVVEDRSSKRSVEVRYWSDGDTVMQVFSPQEDIELTELQMSSIYTVTVRYSCGNGLYGEWDTLSFATQMNPENIIYVSEQATGNNSGSSWANAKTDLADALNLAKLLATDNKYPQIWVAQGTYYADTTGVADMGLPIAFALTDGVSMFGGFAGNEPANYDLSQRNFEAHPTILDGQHIHTVVLGVPLEIIMGTQTIPNGFEHRTVCDGFTIQNSSGLSGIIFLGNMELSHCIVKDNLGEAGGIYAIGNTANPAMLKRCRFISNMGVAGGGLVLNTIIDSCVFSGNTGVETGGLYAVGSTVRHSEIADNLLNGQATEQSAGGCKSIASTLEHCIIVRNTTENQNVGGVVFTHNSNIAERYGIFGNNSMTNCLVADNDGTGLSCLSNSINITNTTIANNSHFDVSVGSELAQAPVLSNCIIWSEGKENITQGTIIGNHSAATGELAGTSNIILSADNLGDENGALYVAFVDPENGDYHLTQFSDCIDAGVTLTSTDTLDLAGNPRVFGSNPDMGCYEYNGELYCFPAAKIVVSNIDGNSALITWDEMDATDSTSTYQLEYKSDDESQWNVIADLTQSNLLLKNLFPNSHYIVRITHVCDSIHQSRYTTSSFRTVCEYDYTEGIIAIAPSDSSSSTEPLPSDFHYGFSYSQQIFTADELNLPATDISAIWLQYYNNDTIARNIDVYMGHSSTGYFENDSAWIPVNSLSLVYSGNVTFSNTNDGNWVVIPLTDTFYYDGLQNLVIAIDDNTGISVNNASSGFYTHGIPGLRSLFTSASYDIDPSDYSGAECPSTCNYTLELNDSYGDGWNGGHLTVTQSDYLEETYTIESGSSANYTVSLCSRKEASFSYVTGSYPGENSFVVKDQNGTVVWSHQGSNNSATQTFTPNCGGVIVDNEVADGYSFRNNLRLTTGLSCPDSGCARTNFIITQVTDTTADLEFAFGTDITSIELKYYSLAGSDTSLLTLGTTNSTYHLTGLNPSTQYQICIRSVCDTSHTSSWMEKYFITDANADNIIYVSKQASGNNSGSSWENAKTDLADALHVASFISARGATPRIWVAHGTYYGDTSDVTNFPIAFTMYDGIQMFGGFAGNEPANFNLSLRDFEAHPTILDGQNKQVTLCIPREILMEIQQQTILAGFEHHTVCDGFTIQNGIGGVFLIGNMELSHCTIRNNNGIGGVYSLGSVAKPAMLRHCRVTDNMGQDGGGAFLSTIIDSCVFSRNTGSGVGGILVVGSTVRNSEISGNTLTGPSGTQKAGGCASVSSTLENCKIVHNSTENQNVGGVVFYYMPQYGEIYGIYGNNSMSNCLVADNAGTGLNCLSGAADIISSTIANNSLVDVSVSTQYQSDLAPVFTNCIIWSSDVEQSFAGPVTGLNSAAVGNLSGTNNINLSADNLGNEDSVLYVAFVDPENGDYRLMQNSACIDAGATLSSSITLDLAGNPRVYGTSPDMGCYEYGGEFYCLPPQNLSVSDVTTSSAMVTWAPYDTNNIPVRYELAYRSDDTSSWTIVPNLTTTQYLLENLPKCSQISVKVRAFCDDTSASGFSTTTQFFTECCEDIGGSISLVIGNTTTSEMGHVLPTYSYYNYSYSQQIFLASELANISHIDTIAFQYSSNEQRTRQIDIYLGHTTKNSFSDGSDWISADALTLVFSGTVTFSNEGSDHWFNIPFNSIFEYNGVDNLVVVVDDNTGSYQSGANFYTHNTNVNRTLYKYSDGTNYDPFNPGSLQTSTFRNNIKINGIGCYDGECPTPALSVTDITDTSVRLAIAYQSHKMPVEVQYWASGDTITRIYTPDESIVLSGILAGTPYTATARYVCGDSLNSEWDTVSFATLLNSENIIYVSEQANGNGSGESWTNAKNNLTDALALAELMVYENLHPQIWVAQGTYYGDTLQNSAFTLVDGINLYGGFAGIEPADFDLSQRDFEVHPTILDGQNRQTVIHHPNSGLTQMTIVNGFTIRNGYSSGSGGGVLVQGPFEIAYCKIENNYCELHGGGIMLNASNAYMHHCEVFNNVSQSYGGGGEIEQGRAESCHFHNNTARYGAGVRLSNATLSNSIIENNSAVGSGATGGGVQLVSSSIYQSLIANNTSQQNGGGATGNNTSHLYGCDIVNNNATSSGGALFGSNRIHVHSSIVWGNKKGFYADSYETVLFYNCAVEGTCNGSDNIEIASSNDGYSPTMNFVRFLDPENGDFRLHPSSICVNMGQSDWIQDSTDFFGNPRIFGSNIDMGYHEVQETSGCSPVTNLMVDSVSSSTALLTWHSEGNVSSWIVKFSLTGEENDTTFMVQDTSCLLTGLMHNRGYTAHVRSLCPDSAMSVFSRPVHFTTFCNPDLLDTLSNFVTFVPEDSTVIYQNRVSFSWNSLPEATSYDFYLWKTTAPEPTTPTETGLTVSSLQNYYLPQYSYGAEYYWKVVAWNECVSKASPVNLLRVSNLPDLHVSQITCSTPIAGQTMTVSWTVTNDGLGSTPPGSTWHDYIWLVSDCDVRLYDNNDLRLLDVENVQLLDAGESYTNTAQITIPDSYIENYFLFVFTDQVDAFSIEFGPTGGIVPDPYTPSASGNPYPYLSGNVHQNGNITELSGKENDNFFYKVLNILPPPAPDLVVGNIVHPTNVFSGNDISLSWTISNIGQATAPGNWVDAVYIQDTNVFNATTAYRLGRYTHTDGLESDSSYVRTEQVHIPIQYMGDYYFFVQTDAMNNVYEGLYEGNNMGVSSLPLTVTMTPPCDLVVSDIFIQAEASPNQVCPFKFTVSNEGSSPTPVSRWTDAVYLAQTDSLDTHSAFFLGNFTHNGTLTADSSYLVSGNITLPADISGNWNLFVMTDKNNNVFEYIFENNNVTRYHIPIHINAPDLTISNLSVPDHVNPNEPFAISWTIRNDGSGDLLNRYFTDIVSLNESSTLYSSSYSNVTLLSGDSIRKSALISIPCVTDSAIQITVHTDGHLAISEQSDSNNTVFAEISVMKPDLVVSEITCPDSAWSGTDITITYDLINYGNVSLLDKTVTNRIYLSDSPSDYQMSNLVGTRSHTISLLPTQYMTDTCSISIPNGVSGLVYLHVVCDALNNVCETSETNNEMHSTATLVRLSPYPDLVVTSISIPDTVIAGTKMLVNYTLANNGIANISNANVTQKFYFSSSPTNFYNSDLLSSRVENLTLAVDSVIHLSALVPISASLSAGNHYLHILTDAENALYEYNGEDNNTGISNKTFVKIYQLDLAAISLTGPDHVEWGQTVQYQLTAKNNSSLPSLANYWWDALIRSTSSVLHASDPIIQNLLVSSVVVEPDSIYKSTFNVTIPFGTPSEIYLFAIVDYDNSNPDIDPMNNMASKRIEVSSVPTPDLAVTSLSVLGDVTSGQSARVAYTVSNIGSVSIDSADWNDKFFLSSNNLYEPSDIQLSSRSKSNMVLLPGAYYSDTIDITVPLPNNGTMYLIAKTNSANNPYEVNTENNMTAVPITVTLPLPGDLVVTNISSEDTLVSGEMIHVSWDVQNIGDNTLAGHGLRSLVYISSDTVFDATDKMLGYAVSNINLVVDASIRQNLSARISGIAEGYYYLIVKTDVTNAFNEVNDANNTSHSPEPFALSIRPLPFNTTVNDTLYDDLVSDFKMSVGNRIGETVRIHVHSEDSMAGAVNMIFATHNNMGSNLNYNYSTIGQYTSNPELFIPATESGYYGVNVYGSTPDGDSQATTIRADILPFDLLSVSPNYGGNTGSVTLELTGSRFRPNMQVWMMNDNDTIYADTLVYVNYYQSYASFDLTDKDTGTYDVGITSYCEGDAVLRNAFHIQTGQPEQLATNLIFPNSPRPNRMVVMTLEFGNIGNIDIQNAILEVNSLGGSKIALSAEGLSNDTYRLLIPLTIEGEPDGLLRPGASGTINIYTYTGGSLIFTTKRIQ